MNKDGSDKQPLASRKSKAAEAREARLKEALRANLHRRKGQTRARKSDTEPDGK
jgi:hypothetical protein